MGCCAAKPDGARLIYDDGAAGIALEELRVVATPTPAALAEEHVLGLTIEALKWQLAELQLGDSDGRALQSLCPSPCARLSTQGAPGVGRANVFVVWAYATPLASLVAALEQYRDATGVDCFWIEGFSTAPPNGVEAVVTRIKHTVLVLQPWECADEGPLTLHRLDCLKELAYTALSGAHFGVAIEPALLQAFATAEAGGDLDADDLAAALCSVDPMKAAAPSAEEASLAREEIERALGAGIALVSPKQQWPRVGGGQVGTPPTQSVTWTVNRMVAGLLREAIADAATFDDAAAPGARGGGDGGGGADGAALLGRIASLLDAEHKRSQMAALEARVSARASRASRASLRRSSRKPSVQAGSATAAATAAAPEPSDEDYLRGALDAQMWYDEPRQLLLQEVILLRTQLGERHPDTLTAIFNLAAHLSDASIPGASHAAALPLLRAELAAQAELHGRGADETIDSAQMLAATMAAAGDPDGGAALLHAYSSERAYR